MKPAATKHRRADKIITRLLVGLFSLVLIGFVVCNAVVSSYSKYIITDQASVSSKMNIMRVAIVFGGGITVDKQPSEVVASRLDAAAKLYEDGVIDKILVSGDNRFIDYNEPLVMQSYLESSKQIPAYDIQQDNAGRSTYETCERAVKVFGLREAVLISQNSHLPRAIFLCRSFGMQAYGYPATDQSLRVSQSFRELGANIKAVFNVYGVGEKTVLGSEISF